MHCNRFVTKVYITRHARERMTQRAITEDELSGLLESGELRYKHEKPKHIPGQTDNLICAAVALEDQLIVKTVMHRFEWEH